MRWIALSPLFFLITSCIYTEGQVIREPEDVVIPAQIYQFTPNYPCQNTIVTKPQQTVRCPQD